MLINPDASTPEEMFANEVAGKPFPVLKEVKGKEVVSNKNDQTHILIEGDNYHSLAVLNFTHQEAIDVIYIDPPYNTGNKDFIYTDKYQSDYVIKDDPFRHSKWLTFMEKRLKLAKKLLKKDGAIFISIDDHEHAPLKMLCDEIFGEENFIDSIIWDKKSSAKGVPPKNMMVNVHEYILAYQNGDGFKFVGQERTEESGKFKNPDNDPRGPWRESNIKSTIKSANQAFTIIDPNTGKKYTNTWAFSKESLDRMIKENRILWKDTLPKQKEFMNEMRNENMAIRSNWGVFDAQSTTVFLKDLLPNTKFDNPKPISLMEYLIRVATKKDATILDFFAGSGTIAHAILKINSEDDGNRKFILCTNNENNIATEVCHLRLQKIMKGYKNNKDEKIKGFGGNLKYYTAYDFVESEPSDKNKHKLVNKCTEMLCIKEGIYDLETNTEDYKIFKSHDDRYLGIIFYEDAIEEYKKAIKKINGPINTYVFSLGDDPHTAQFADVADKVVLQAIPEIILKVYQEIFR
ncbi:MAG TPA: site-specific DNA-methyltransferase [Candidatus Paceibacterota bacterium]|nr:site-specific DNA-methyltransferase [Candidatus Paceibacterota bacterium]